MELAEVMHRDGNISIVQLPGRKFPAIAVQGDTFRGFLNNIKDAVDVPDLKARAEELDCALRQMQEALDVYAAALKVRNLPLPWNADER